MTRKQLEDLGLTKEQVDAVIAINGADIEAGKLEIKNLQTEVASLNTQIAERDTQLESLRTTAGDNADLKQQIETLQAENATAKESHAAEMTRLKVDFAVEKALTGAKAKNLKAVRALLDLEDAKLDKEGNVKGLSDQIDKLVAGEDTKFLFDTQQPPNPGFRGFQPGGSGTTPPEGPVDMSKMTYEELAAYIENNPDVE